MRRCRSLALVLLAIATTSVPAAAAITSIEVRRTESFADGTSFGATGAYLKVVGVAHGELDPAAPANRGTSNEPRARHTTIDVRFTNRTLGRKDLHHAAHAPVRQGTRAHSSRRPIR